MNIDGIDIDPYFIMSVTQADSEEFVTKAFKKKAKIWHPDRATAEERNNPAIMNKKKKQARKKHAKKAGGKTLSLRNR